MVIRRMIPADWEPMRQIYAHYIEHTTITFDVHGHAKTTDGLWDFAMPIAGKKKKPMQVPGKPPFTCILMKRDGESAYG